MAMESVKKLSGSLGAEILGMNLENDLSESMLTDIKGYFNELSFILREYRRVVQMVKPIASNLLKQHLDNLGPSDFLL